MKIFLGFLALISCTIYHVKSLEHWRDVEDLRKNPMYISPNPNVRNPLLFGSSADLTVLDKLQNIRNKMEEIEKKNTDLPVVSPVRGPTNQFQSINSFIDDLSVINDNNEQANAFKTQPLPMLEKVPTVPSSVNGYFMMFRLKQNASHLVPTKSQSIFLGNEQQQYIQQISAQKPEQILRQQQPLIMQTQVTNQQKYLNNQQMHIRKLNIQDQSTNYDNLLSGQQNLANQQQLKNNQVHHFGGPQRLINQTQFINDQKSQINFQKFSGNEGSVFNSHQNILRHASNEKTSMNRFPVRSLQQPTINSQVLGEQGILSISRQSTLNHYMRPLEIIASNVPNTENPTKLSNNFEYPSEQQIQAFSDKFLAKIENQALNGELQPIFTDVNKNTNNHPTIISVGATNNQASVLSDFESSKVPVPTSGSQILHEARLPTGASVKQHLKTPYANYDFTHVL